MMRLFPMWAAGAGPPRGRHRRGRPEAARHAARRTARRSRRSSTTRISIGALVTTHKIDLLDATRDMFDYLDPYAILCDEVSSISKLDGRLEGHAKDPISSGLSLDAVVGDGYFAPDRPAQVLCFGAGGSAVAIALHLINKPDPADRPASSSWSTARRGGSTPVRRWSTRWARHPVRIHLQPGSGAQRRDHGCAAARAAS